MLTNGIARTTHRHDVICMSFSSSILEFSQSSDVTFPGHFCLHQAARTYLEVLLTLNVEATEPEIV